MGDRSEILHQLLSGHADPVVLDRQGARFTVGGNRHLQWQLGIQDILFGRLDMPELLHRVRGVRNQLAKENLAVGIEGVHHQVEELLNLRLETVFFGSRRTHGARKIRILLSLSTEWSPVISAARHGASPSRGSPPRSLRLAHPEVRSALDRPPSPPGGTIAIFTRD